MAVNENDRIARSLKGKDAASETPDTERRQGQVVSVQTDGTATVTIAADPQPISGVMSDSNYVPVAGQTVWLDVSDTEVTIVGKTGTSPSVFAGIRSASVSADEARAATTFGALATAGPAVSVIIGDSGLLVVSVSAKISVTSDNDGGAVSCSLSGANTVAASLARSLQFFPAIINAFMAGSRVIYYSGLNPGATTVTMQYMDLVDTGSDVFFANRELLAMPL